jgi:hypothetical protein
MLKKFLNGLVFGAGICVAFIIAPIIYAKYISKFVIKPEPYISSEYSSQSRKTITSPPDLPDNKRFHGLIRFYSPEFKRSESVELSDGPGQFVGTAKLNDTPVANLKLRLAVNGKALTQWVFTDANGQYIINVPYGDYRIDGYEFDKSIADRLLTGKIEQNSRNDYTSSVITISKDQQGRGILFRFVDPIKLKIPKNKYSIHEQIEISWDHHPDADKYKIQLLFKEQPYGPGGRILFKNWNAVPTVSDNSFTFHAEEHGLKIGLFYSVEISALKNKNNRRFTTNIRKSGGYDFEITE